jgi:hypothetical protein
MTAILFALCNERMTNATVPVSIDIVLPLVKYRQINADRAFVIASKAKQSNAKTARLDCFGTTCLAMTAIFFEPRNDGYSLRALQ